MLKGEIPTTDNEQLNYSHHIFCRNNLDFNRWQTYFCRTKTNFYL